MKIFNIFSKFRRKSGKKKLQSSNLGYLFVLSKYGNFYIEYREETYWWEFIKIIEKALITFVISFYYQEIYFKGIFIFLIVALYCTLQSIYAPFKIHSNF